MKAPIYNSKGKEAGTIELPETLFNLPWNADLVYQVVTGMNANKRAGTADTKGRGEVRGGGKKPWKQKGTGRARHGSSRSPIWRGGGVTHGPLAEKNYKQKINKKMKTKALFTVLSEKFKKGHILFVDNFDTTTGKTKDNAFALQSLSQIKGFERLAGKKTTATLVLPDINIKTARALRNIPQISIEYVKNINPVDVLTYKYLIITDPEKSIASLALRTGEKK